jgi:hypothetical protein
MPDIVYTIGYPGQMRFEMRAAWSFRRLSIRDLSMRRQSAFRAIVGGGYSDRLHGYQTNRFRAAAPGALVANMTSAYSGIRWGTGLTRQFQYEHTQSRIGGSLWEYPMRYLEKLTRLPADRVQTPILNASQ